MASDNDSGTWLATGSFDKRVKIWSTDGNVIHNIVFRSLLYTRNISWEKVLHENAMCDNLHIYNAIFYTGHFLYFHMNILVETFIVLIKPQSHKNFFLKTFLMYSNNNTVVAYVCSYSFGISCIVLNSELKLEIPSIAEFGYFLSDKKIFHI